MSSWLDAAQVFRRFTTLAAPNLSSSPFPVVSYDFFCEWRGFHSQALFTVYDGHGKEGDLCAMFCKETLPVMLSKELKESRTVEDALKRAFNRTNQEVRWGNVIRSD